MKYAPPQPEDLHRLKTELGRSSEQMADLFALASGQQWRKYTGGIDPRTMSMPMLFQAAARLVLSAEDYERVLERMREVGAVIEL